MHVSMMHVSMMHVSRMHVSRMHVSIMHVSRMDVCMMHIASIHDAYLYDPWPWCVCMYDAYIYEPRLLTLMHECMMRVCMIIYLWSSFPDLDACMIHECMMHISMISVPDVCMIHICMMRISVILVPGPDACMMCVSWCLSVWCILLLLLLPLKIGSKNVTNILLMGGAAAGANRGTMGLGYIDF